MRLKDIDEGEVYAVVRYFDRRIHTAVEDGHRLEAKEWEGAYSTLGCARVLATGVQVPGYARPGVRVQWLDRQTLEPRRRDDGEPVAPEEFLALHVLMPWAEWDRRWHTHVEDEREAGRRRREEREREQARRQEKAAREWMARVFAEARSDIEEVVQVLDGLTHAVIEEEVRALVDLRYPDGNPYLNGSRSA